MNYGDPGPHEKIVNEVLNPFESLVANATSFPSFEEITSDYQTENTCVVFFAVSVYVVLMQ